MAAIPQATENPRINEVFKAFLNITRSFEEALRSDGGLAQCISEVLEPAVRQVPGALKGFLVKQYWPELEVCLCVSLATVWHPSLAHAPQI